MGKSMSEAGIRFDLQLFAEGEGAEAQETDAAAESGVQEEAPKEAEASGTILGTDAGKQPEGGAGAPEAYDFKGIVPEGMEYDEASAKAFGSLAREAGLTQDQAAKIAQYGMQYMQQGVEGVQKQQQAAIAQWGEDAKAQLGAQFQPTVAKAVSAINRIETRVPGIKQMLDETGVGNRVEAIRLFAAFGDLLGEDGGHDGDSAGGAPDPYPNTDWTRYK